MAFLAPLIVGAIGLTGTAALVGTAITEIAIGYGLSYAARRLSRRNQGSSAQGGSRLSLQLDPNSPREVIFGTAPTGGTLTYWQLSSTDNARLHMVIELAGHQCDSLVELWVRGELRTWDSGTGVVSGFNNKLKVRFYNGSATQTADSAVVSASGGRWTANERGLNTCYAVVEADYDAEVFPGGISDLNILFVVKGAALYDPRFDTTAGGSGSQRWATPSTWTHSDNPAVVLYNMIRGFSSGGVKLLGLSAPSDAIRFSDFSAAANACDELIARKAGGTEPRYRIGGVFDCRDERNRSHIQRAITAMAGEAIESGGIYRIRAGVAQSSVATLTDEDLIVSEPFIEELKRPRSELTNAVEAAFTDPSQGWNVVPLPVRRSSTDETTDGGVTGPIRLAQVIDLSDVRSRTQAQRIMEVERRRARRQKRVSCVVRSYWFRLEPGDWITLNSSRRGFSGTFEVVQRRVRRDLTTELLLAEIDDQIDDWNAATDEIDDNQQVSLSAGGPTLTTVSGLALANVVVEASGGSQRPGLTLTWTPVTDATVLRLEIEFRKVGDSTAIRIPDVNTPSSGSTTWLTGVQSGVTYEARIRPVTEPVRSVNWTAWASTAGNTANQVVPVALVGETVPPGAIGAAELDDQTRFELALSSALSSVQGSVADRVNRINSDLQKLATALLTQRVQGQQNFADVRTEIATRQTLSESFAAYQVQTDALILDPVTGVANTASAVSGLTSRVVDVEDAVVAAEARAYLNVSVSGATGTVTGGIDVYANALFSIISLLADKFVVARPDGTGAKQVFTTGSVNGVTNEIGITGDVVIDGTILARHITVATLAAITANIGTITAGRLQNAANDTYLDLNTGDFQIG